ncbi:MAG: twin-arginine translocation signal domain-containing protein, partial [Clostridiales bacterium]|nr:twin-arginine translocation signal domain-containing protein [Clostridiales bacterium]
MAKKQPISRRDFIKGMAAGAASVVTLGVLQACESGMSSTAASTSSSTAASSSGTTAASSMSYTPGTYSASAAGISSDVT